jgi:hypothetical protein
MRLGTLHLLQHLIPHSRTGRQADFWFSGREELLFAWFHIFPRRIAKVEIEPALGEYFGKREVEMKELVLVGQMFGYGKQADGQFSTFSKVAKVLRRDAPGTGERGVTTGEWAS